MNQQIKELAEQAREYATTRHPVSNNTLSVNSDLFEQKFAELIVLECINLLPDECQCDESKIHASWKIKQHFGVKP